ncbi:MAG: hypothetical protein IKV73_02875, partial [Clostridia bacterium]|nr:hypothetical protein [Clostridia bacterium]
VAVTATDSYGSSLTTTHTFTTGRDTTDGSTSLGGAALISANAAPTAGGSVSKWAGANVNYNNPYYPNNFDLMVYKLGLPSVSAGAYIEKASLVFPAWGGTSTTTIENYLRLFKLPGEAWDLTTMKSSDDAAAAYLSDYDAYSAENGVAFKSASTGTWQDGRIYEADITDYVNECIAAQQSYLYIAVTAENQTAKLAGTSYGYGSTAHIEYTVNNAPALEFVNKSATVNGATLSAFSFDVLTSFDKAVLESKVSLQYANGNVVDDAEFVYASGTVSLKAPVVLDEEANYKVVVEIGTQDKFGNSVTAEDSVVYEFATTKNFVIADPILVSASTEIENTTDFASLTSLTEVADAKAVTSFTNNLATTKHIYVAAASYDSNGELLAVSMDDVSISAGATYTVASSAISAEGAATIKAFVWDYSDQITPLAASCTIGAAR